MFFKNVFSYGLVNCYAQLTRFIQEFVIRFILPPEVLGLWSLVLLIQSFGLSLDWGVLTASARELPLLYGAKQFKKAADYRVTVFYLHTAGKLLAGIGIICYQAFTHPLAFHTQFVAIIAAALMVVISSVGEAFVAFYQSAQQYVALSKKLFIYWTCYAFMLVAGAHLWAVKGLIIAVLLTFILQAIVLRDALHYLAKGVFESSLIKPILSFALPFRGVDFPMSMAMMLDGLFVAKFLGLKALAIYTTAKLILNQTGQVPTWVGSVFITRMTTLMGRGNARASLGEELLKNLTALYLVVLPILIGLTSLATYWGVSIFLPKYAEVIIFIPVLLISLYFQPRVVLIRNFWIIEKQFSLLAISNMIAISLMVIGFAGLYFLKVHSLLAVSFVFTISFSVYHLFVTSWLGMQLWGLKKLCLLLAELVVAIAFLVIAMKFSGLFIQASSHGFDLKAVLMSVFEFFTVILPLVIYGGWRIDAMTYVRRILVSLQRRLSWLKN